MCVQVSSSSTGASLNAPATDMATPASTMGTQAQTHVKTHKTVTPCFLSLHQLWQHVDSERVIFFGCAGCCQEGMVAPSAASEAAEKGKAGTVRPFALYLP